MDPNRRAVGERGAGTGAGGGGGGQGEEKSGPGGGGGGFKGACRGLSSGVNWGATLCSEKVNALKERNSPIVLSGKTASFVCTVRRDWLRSKSCYYFALFLL